MCAGAISHARIARLYYGASDPTGGAVEQGGRIFIQPQCLHRPDVYDGLGGDEAANLLRDFFSTLLESYLIRYSSESCFGPRLMGEGTARDVPLDRKRGGMGLMVSVDMYTEGGG